MTEVSGLGIAFGLAVGAFFGALLARWAIADPPAALVRTNFKGRSVPAVLGVAVVVAGLLPAITQVVVAATSGSDEDLLRHGFAALVVIVILGGAGVFDDLRGEESERGFSGHLGAAGRGRVTGGMVKLVSGGVAGLAAGAILSSGRGVVEIGLCVALVANLINLLDRAPGRAGKSILLLALPLLIFGSEPWAVTASGAVGALAVCLPFDVRERGMLGDAGANPVGGLVGLGLALSLDEALVWVAIAVLAALNLASEKWSFSAIIERTAPLAWFDRLGRRSDPQLPEK